MRFKIQNSKYGRKGDDNQNSIILPQEYHTFSFVFNAVEDTTVIVAVSGAVVVVVVVVVVVEDICAVPRMLTSSL